MHVEKILQGIANNKSNFNPYEEEQVVLEADYKILQNDFKEANSITEETRNKQEANIVSSIGKQINHSDVSLKKLAISFGCSIIT